MHRLFPLSPELRSLFGTDIQAGGCYAVAEKLADEMKAEYNSF